jgi:hypothetical protein
MSPSNQLLSPLIGSSSSFKIKDREKDDDIASAKDGDHQHGVL